MRTIIAGSRDCNDYELLKQIIEEAKEAGIIPTVILSGGATGVDKLGEKYAKEFKIKLEKFPAKWKDTKGKPEHQIGENKFGKYWKLAGLKRNEEMAANAEALIAISLGTPGTEHMVSTAKRADLLVYEHRPEGEEIESINFWDD